MKKMKLFVLVLLSQCAMGIAQQDWWPTIVERFGGSSPPVKRCRKRKNIPPTNSSQCDKEPKLCFFGDQSCPDSYPSMRCTCAVADGVRNGKWSCVPEPCPSVEAPIQEPAQVVADVAPAFFRSSIGSAFDVQMNLLTNDVLSGYDSVEAMCEDLNQTVRFYVNAFIDEQSRYQPIQYSPFDGEDIPVLQDAVAIEQAQTLFGPPVNSPSAAGATDFGTNNQEEGVDEADFVKSDGKYVYAAYGDTVVVWVAQNGDLIINYTLPALAEVSQNGGFGGNVFDSFFAYKPKPYIQGMSLEGGKLVLYVQGYGPEVLSASSKKSVFYNAYDTRIVVFDTSALPASLNVLSTQDVHGSYRDARAIGSNIHVVTTADIDYYTLLNQPLYRWDPVFAGLDDTEYVAAAAAIAEPLINDFVTALKDDVLLLGIPKIPKVAIWQSELGNNTNIVEDIYRNGAIQAFAQITSFSVAGLTAGPLEVKTSGALTPSSWGYTYAVDGNLIFAAQAYNWSPEYGGSVQTTYLMGFNLNGTTATPAFLGSVPGYINSQFYLNIYKGAMSVATTVETFWPVWEPTVDESGSMIWPQPQFTTDNSIFVFQLPTESAPNLTEVGRVSNLGLPGERFTAVRFFGNICYAVTFRQTDPFYVISTDPTNVQLLGELKVTGFSSYLHSINDDNTLLVGVGEEADETGRVLGVQISLFNATNATGPTLLSRLVVEQQEDVWSSSTVQWDFKAFRYLSLGIDFGIIIIPLQVVAWYIDSLDGNFDGFLAFDVSAQNGISQRLNVSHVQSQDFYSCYYRANLPERSLVFNGNLTTMKGHSVISTDLDTGERRWELEMPKPVLRDECVPWLFSGEIRV